MIEMSGAEFKRFYECPEIWVEGTSWEGSYITVDGDPDESIDLKEVENTAAIVVCGGELMDQPRLVPNDLEKAILWWREKQVSTEFLIRVPKDKVDAFKAALAELGAVIIGNA